MDATVDGSDLLKAIAAGDHASLRTLYEQHGPSVLGYLVRLADGDRGTAEELLQDTFVAVWKTAGSFEGRSSVRTWLMAIARRRAVGRFRRLRLSTVPLESVVHMDGNADESSLPEESALAGLDRSSLRALVESLSPLHREPLVLAVAHELSMADIAEVLEIPIGTVKSRLAHARIELRRLAAARGLR